MPRALRALAFAAALTVPLSLSVSRPAAQAGPKQKHSVALDAWWHAVDSHVPGQADAAVALVRQWPASKLDDVVSELLAIRDAADLTTDARDRILERGALLHADVAILAYRPDATTYDLPPDGHDVVIVKDGEAVRHVSGTFHWAFARRLLDSVAPPTSARDEYARAWYEATAAVLQSWQDHAELEPHLVQAFNRFPKDAELLLIQGTMHARFAAPEFQQTRQGDASVPTSMPVKMETTPVSFGRPVALSQPVMAADDERQAAETAFRAALKADPTLAEAHLRLGDMLGRDGRHAEALKELEAALTGQLPVPFRYDASLLAGREQEAAGEAADARTSYARAIALYPHARTARLALSRILREAGDRDAASHELEELTSAITVTDDPWWLYDGTHAPSAEALLASLRALTSPDERSR